MMKKTIFFILCLAPLGAQAAITVNGTEDSPLTGYDVTEAISVDNMVVGGAIPEDASAYNNFYAGQYISDNFTVLSGTGITVNDTVEILEDYYLGLGSSSGTAGGPINVSLGAVNAFGEFVVQNVGDFSVTNGIMVGNGFVVQSNSMGTGAIDITGGVTNVNVTGNAQMLSLSNTGSGTTYVKAGSIYIGDKDAGATGFVQNGGNAQSMTLVADNNIDITGSINNYTSDMNIDAGGDVVVSGTISNDDSMNIEAANLNVIGGGTQQSPSSFSSSGDLIINVSGVTTFAYGLDLSSMAEDDVFSLETGTLNFGSQSDWSGTFTNKLNSFTLTINDTAFDILGDIKNGFVNSSTETPDYNQNASMTLTVPSLAVNSITNYASLVINATEGGATGTGVVVRKGMETAEGSYTNIDSANALNVVGNISNSGEMLLKANDIQLAGLTNSGGDVSVVAPTSAEGSILISGNVTNTSGTTNINAKDINIAGNINNISGTTSIVGSDTNGTDLQVGAINVFGGSLDIGALIGSVAVANGVSVGKQGTLNIGSSTKSFVAKNSIQIAGDLNFGGTGSSSGNGGVNVAASGAQNFLMYASSAEGILTIGGTLNLTQENGAAYNATLAANTMTINDVNVSGTNNTLVLGNGEGQQLTVNEAMNVSNGATVELVVDDTDVGSLNVLSGGKLIASGRQITATNGNINIADNVWFNGNSGTSYSGLIVKNTDSLSLKSDTGQISIAGGINLGAENNLTLEVGDTENQVETAVVKIGNVIGTSGTLNINVNGISEANVLLAGVNITGDGVVNIDSNIASNVIASDKIIVNGDVVQGAQTGSLNFLADDITVAGVALNSAGSYFADNGSAVFEFSDDVAFGGNLNVGESAETTFGAASFSAAQIDNMGGITINTDSGIIIDSVDNEGTLVLNSGNGSIAANNFVVGNVGTVTLMGQGISVEEVFSTQNSILYQNSADAEVNIASNNYVITTNQFNAAGVNQVSGNLQINANTVNITGDVIGTNVKFGKTAVNSWADATIGGSVFGGVDFWGIKSLSINNNYTFDNNSDLWVAVMPENETTKNYWATIEATADNKIGEITNADNGEALITVGNKFISNISGIVMDTADTQPQVGVTLFDTVDQGTAIWLLHAENGIEIADAFEKLRNLDVKFCNASGSICINYADALQAASDGTYSESGNLPIYISERDTDGDGIADSLYVVFDPNFGGPVNIFKLQPIVADAIPHTNGEYISAGALDNLIAGQLQNTEFYNNSPIEIIPQIFSGTNLAQMADELYERMEYYNMTGESQILVNFSRLFQPRELEQIAGSVALNEHTNFRDFEDRMLDEFIWNRNRNLKKAWLDADFGMFFQNVSDGKHADGQRFSISGGFDWQHSEKTLFGLTGRVSNSTSDNSDAIELGYLPNTSVSGLVDLTVDDLNIGVGAYMIKILGEKTRLYGNAFLDAHFIDVSRDQTLVDHIDGSGNVFSIISEWGLMHDWLNQYIVGNAYARVGYNFGFDVSEQAGGQDYMEMQSDGYLILTPGYTLTAQKRIYPSAWFQIRPYASVGVEYDVLGAPDYVKYKFALADKYTKYDVDIDPLWANIGGGVEFLSANGIQVGVDYRYQYNDAIQLHNIKLSGSYRF